MTPQRPIPLTQPSPPAVRRFGKYYFVRKLAEGGMAEIYLAKQAGAEGFERNVVIKCMLNHLSQSREFVEMFLDEARLAARLLHPNIVQITDLGVADGRYFICMEYLPGEDLQAIVERCAATRQPIPLAVASKIMLSACEGLDFAHTFEEGGKPVHLVHRDVSPSNIIVTYQGTVKVLDFGIAKASSKLVQTQPGLLKGKMGYMSPEQGRGEALDARSDVFSLGVTFHELLTGQRVFKKESELAVLVALMQQPIPPPSQARPDIPPALDRIVLRAVARKPDERYPSAGAMRADLEAYLASTSSIPGVTQLAHYMQSLFGREQAERKTHVPPLKEILGGEAELPPLPSDATEGFEPTFVRSAALSPRAAATQAAHGATASPAPASSPTQELFPAAPRPAGSRMGPALLGALITLVLVVGGAGTFVFLRAPGLLSPPAPSAPSAPVPVPQPLPSAGVPPPPVDPPPPVTPTPPSPPAPVASPVAPTPAPTPPRPAPPIRLAPREVGSVLGRSTGDIRACFERHRTALPAAAGEVHVTLTIQHSGAVSDARVSTEGLEDSPLSACIVKVVKAVRFPRNDNEPLMSISVPFRYGTGGG